MKLVEKFFEIETPYSKKHKLNTCNKKVPQQYLDEIERGCSIEQLETMMRKKFDVFKYKTQITIHGIFPELSTRRVGCYVNLTQNKNQSVGVRYTAIDNEKKERLFGMLQTLKLYSVEHNSTRYSIYKMKELPSNWEKNREQIMEIVREYEAEAKRIDRSLFVGNVSCYIAQGMWRCYMCLDVNICCFYESNFEKLFENLSGMTFEEGRRKCEEAKQKEAEERKKLDELYERKRRETESKEKELRQNMKKFAEENPLKDFVQIENYTPQNGDIIASVHKGYDGSLYWRMWIFKKCFGKMNQTPCDENGSKTQRGSEALKNYPHAYVKRAV